MGRSIVVTTGPVGTGTRALKKARKLFRGVTRTLIRKTLAKIVSLKYADERALNRGALLGFTAAEVGGYGNDANRRAFTAVESRLRECLAAMEGDQ